MPGTNTTETIGLVHEKFFLKESLYVTHQTRYKAIRVPDNDCFLRIKTVRMVEPRCQAAKIKILPFLTLASSPFSM